MIEKLSEKAFEVIDKYSHLNIGNVKVRAPYFMNLKGERAGLRVMVGKGTVDEIELEVKIWAQLKGFDITKATEEQIRKFMMERSIGIDCSGFASYIINAELESRGMRSLQSYLKYKDNSLFAKIRRFLRPIENIGADLMTSDLNCKKIKKLNNVKPLDLIRAKGKQKNAHHVAVITKVEREDGEVKVIEYAHSHRFYENQNGIRIGKIIIKDINGELKDQKWKDDLNGRNYMLEDLLVDYKDNGIRRLKFLK